jgi:outer membrane protein assembly factor BamB
MTRPAIRPGHSRANPCPRITRILWLGCGLFLLVLSGCTGTVPPLQSVNITPLTLGQVPGTPYPLSDVDWPMYHGNPARTGYVAAVPDPGHLTRSWASTLDGAVYAQPLVVGERMIAATEHDTLYALDALTGHVLWRTSLGTPVPLSRLPCGNIDPLGITGTPVFDPVTHLVFAVAEITGPAHVLVGVDLATGTVKVRRLVDVPGMDPRTHQQRGALALGGDYIYVAFGGLDGDCGAYHGMVIASRTDGAGPLRTFQVPTTREAGIWAPPGPVIDGQGRLFVSVGNGAATRGAWDHSDSVLRLSPNLTLEDGFAPTSWQSENAGDVDLGSMGPALLPDGLIYADGKGDEGYLLRADHLGGVGGQLQALAVCSAYGGAAVSGKSLFIPCVDGLRQLTVASGPRLVLGWRGPNQVNGSPVVAGHTVYSLDPEGGRLYALDAASGAVRATIGVGPTSRFATPAISGHTLFIGTLAGVVAVQIA